MICTWDKSQRKRKGKEIKEQKKFNEAGSIAPQLLNYTLVKEYVRTLLGVRFHVLDTKRSIPDGFVVHDHRSWTIHPQTTPCAERAHLHSILASVSSWNDTTWTFKLSFGICRHSMVYPTRCFSNCNTPHNLAVPLTSDPERSQSDTKHSLSLAFIWNRNRRHLSVHLADDWIWLAHTRRNTTLFSQRL